jgi:hypothetical protein
MQRMNWMHIQNDCIEDNLPQLEIVENSIFPTNTKQILFVDYDICLLNISKAILELDGDYKIG